MTLEEVKRANPIIDIVRNRGISINRSKMIRCPFHDDRSASMKLCHDHAHCFGCKWHGDVVDFVAAMDGISFKEAFLQLGGTYDEDPGEVAETVKNASIRREVSDLRDRVLRAELQRIGKLISGLQELNPEPFSDEWCMKEDLIFKFERLTDELYRREQRT